jgi:hypothetical protein
MITDPTPYCVGTFPEVCETCVDIRSGRGQPATAATPCTANGSTVATRGYGAGYNATPAAAIVTACVTID